MHVNTLYHTPGFGWPDYWWSHRWENGDAARIPTFTSKFRAWRPLQQRPRDGTIVRNKTGGLRRAA